MNGLTMLHGAEPRDVLQAMIRDKVPAIMSYLSKGKWHATKVTLTNIGAGIELHVPPGNKPRPMNITVGQSVGISVKYGYGKFIFDAKVLNLEPSCELNGNGIIVIGVPAEIELVQRRNYFRVRVPRNINVTVQMWLRHYAEDNTASTGETVCNGKLVDISAGGLQIAVDASEKFNFRNGQFLGLKFRPLPSGEPLTFNAQIRNIFPTADNRYICIGLQTVGLETSSEGRENLKRLCNVVEQYYQWGQLQSEQMKLQKS